MYLLFHLFSIIDFKIIYIIIYSKINKRPKTIDSHFLKQCLLTSNNSKIPSVCPPKTNEPLTSITFEINKIKKIIKNLDPNKSHDYDKISIDILKLWGEFVYKILNLLFKSCSKVAHFRLKGKKLILSQFLKIVINSY